MRFFSLVLLGLLVLVQMELWLGKSGLPYVRELSAEVAALKAANAEAEERNSHAQAELQDLQNGLEIVEERARADLGMIKRDEVLVRFGR
jgi:cell division protein FtsB